MSSGQDTGSYNPPPPDNKRPALNLPANGQNPLASVVGAITAPPPPPEEPDYPQQGYDSEDQYGQTHPGYGNAYSSYPPQGATDYYGENYSENYGGQMYPGQGGPGFGNGLPSLMDVPSSRPPVPRTYQGATANAPMNPLFSDQGGYGYGGGPGGQYGGGPGGQYGGGPGGQYGGNY